MTTPSVGEPPPFQYSSLASDIAFNKDATIHGVFFISDSTKVKPPFQYWMRDKNLWTPCCKHFMEAGFDTFSFCPYSSREHFHRFYPSIPLHKDDIRPLAPQTPPRTNTHRVPPAFASPSVDPDPANTMETDDEIAALREQIRQLQQQQAAQQQNTTTQSTVDPVTAQALSQMAEFLKQSQAMNQQLLSQLSSKSSEPVKEPPMPKWDGNITTKDHYLEQMEVYKSHKYFSSVIDWSQSTPATEDIATFLRSELLKTIPASRRPAYLHQDKCKDGFAFLKLWMSDISPSNVFH
jgi:DNA-binding protein H-NS